MRAASSLPHRLGLGIACAAALSLNASSAWAQDAPALPHEVMQVLAAQHLPASAVSLLVMDPETGHALTGFNASTPRSPASTVKVLTTFASLDMLGPAYTWHTRALLRGELANGVLDGDLILQGGGDPFMTIERWWAFAHALRSKGLKTIRGDIVVDDSAFLLANEDAGAFDGRPHRSYNVLPDALMVNFQSIEFHLTPEPALRKVVITTDPAPVNLIIDNQVRYTSGRCSGASRRVDFDVTSERGDRAVFTGALAKSCEPRSFTRVMLRPADYAFGTFVSLWRELGGEFDGKMRSEPAPPGSPLYLNFDSLTLGEIVRLTNKYSSNLMARHLLLTLGLERYGLPATTQKGAMAIAEWSKARGLSLQDVDIDNGSGLSRATHVTVTEMANVLNAAYHSRYAPEFLTSLPLAGIDGTLRSRLRDTPAGAARLKTGHLNGVSGMAGYVTARSGKTYIIVSLINHRRTDYGAGEPVHAALVDWVLNLP
jgi:serine-type D-Ala-D-Ala carboxypeptidase/endopeptidase (penicillin-binding protein 4)